MAALTCTLNSIQVFQRPMELEGSERQATAWFSEDPIRLIRSSQHQALPKYSCSKTSPHIHWENVSSVKLASHEADRFLSEQLGLGAGAFSLLGKDPT